MKVKVGKREVIEVSKKNDTLKHYLTMVEKEVCSWEQAMMAAAVTLAKENSLLLNEFMKIEDEITAIGDDF